MRDAGCEMEADMPGTGCWELDLSPFEANWVDLYKITRGVIRDLGVVFAPDRSQIQGEEQ
jgi:hypothetical protein